MIVSFRTQGTATARSASAVARASLPLAALLAALAPLPAVAHHSIAAVYDRNRPIEIEGTVTEFLFVHPHPKLVVAVADPSGDGRRVWTLELDNRSELTAIGITAATFKPGDRVVASGSRARANANALYLLRLDRASDGLRYEQVGTEPRIRGGPFR